MFRNKHYINPYLYLKKLLGVYTCERILISIRVRVVNITLHFYTFVDSSSANGLDLIEVTLTLKCKDSNINTNRYIQRSHYASN